MNERQGVPIDEVTAKDFIMVRAALVKRLGGANEALVWSLIEFRANSAKHAHGAGDKLWWAAKYEVIASESGLSRDQVKRTVSKLVEGGFLLAEKHHGSVQTISYSPVIIHRADSPYEGVPSGDIALSIGRIRPTTGAESPDAPSIKTLRTLSKERGATTRGTRIPEPFIVTVAMREWAAKETALVDVDRATRKFVDFWRAKSGVGAAKKDWVATWRNWLRSDQERAEERGSKRPQTPTDRALATIALGASLEQRQAVES